MNNETDSAWESAIYNSQRAEIAEKALEFYANKENWKSIIQKDMGQIAREALELMGDENV